MKVPVTHYVYFWFMNSLMAFGTGFVIGYMFSPFITIPLGIEDDARRLEVNFYISLCFLFFYQFIMPSFFCGKRRGEFEYSFLEKNAESRKSNLELSTLLEDVKQELKMSDLTSAHVKLKSVVKSFPDNFVVLFKYAVSCEGVGLAEDAIETYETAKKTLPESADALINYVEKQICRVKIKGPAKMSSAPGLQYVMY